MKARWLSSLLFLSPIVHGDYQAGLDAFTQGDYATAMREWRQVTDGPPTAVSPGQFIEAHYAVAMLYWEGRGVPQDFHRAFNWLLQPAAMNHAGAQAKLGYLYTNGEGVQQDYDRAFEWFSRAAKQGDVDGLYNLGVFYLNGWGTVPDATLAKQYLAAASALGDEAAEQALEQMLAEGGPASPSVADPGREGSSGAGPADLIQGDASWVLSRDPDHYTIQVFALSSEAKIESLLAGHGDWSPFAVYTVHSAQQPLYVLIQGDYASVDEARRARDAFPPDIQRRASLWIRQFDKIQAELEP